MYYNKYCTIAINIYALDVGVVMITINDNHIPNIQKISHNCYEHPNLLLVLSCFCLNYEIFIKKMFFR